MSVGITFIVEGTAVQPHVFSTISASLFTHLVGNRIKWVYLVTIHKFIFYGNRTKACTSLQLSGAWIYYEMTSLLTYLCSTAEDMSAQLLR